MLEPKPQQPNPQKRVSNKSDGRDINLLENSHIETEIFERRRNYYIPSEPLGIKYFEKTWYIGNLKSTPFYVHITLPIYIICTLIYSMFHVEPLSWFTLNLLLLICHCIFIFIQIYLCLHIAEQFTATIHRIIIWPYGFIGYAADYKQWSHFLIVEYAAPAVHIMIFVLFWGISLIMGTANWNYLTPLHIYFIQNILNGIWVINIIIASLHICIPVYSMKTARLMVNYLYRKRTYREVAQIIFLPTAFMTIILLIFGIVDARPLPLFLSLWTIYQTYLLYDGNRKNLVSKLPLFQQLEDALRDKKIPKQNSIDIVSLHRISMTPLDQSPREQKEKPQHDVLDINMDADKVEDEKNTDKASLDVNDKETLDITNDVSPQDTDSAGVSVDRSYELMDVDTNDTNKIESKKKIETQ